MRHAICSCRLLATLVAASQLIHAKCDIGSPPEFSTRQEHILAFWEAQDRLVRNLPNKVFDEDSPRAYPAEAAVSFLSAYRLTRTQVYLDNARRQLDYAHSSETPDHLHRFPTELVGSAPPEGLVSSNAQARLILNYYVAYGATGSRLYLRWADDAMEGMLRLPLGVACWSGACFDLFYYLYSLEPPYEPYSSLGVNPNQQAFMGLAMTLLYHEPQSRFFHNPKLRDMAVEQLDAALVMQDSSGRLPLSSGPQDQELFDTRYGHLTLMLVLSANRYWNEPRYEHALSLGARWVDTYTKGGARTLRYYPSFYTGPVPDPRELYYRLPILYWHGGDREALEGGLNEVWSRWPSVTEMKGGWNTPFVVLEMIGIPQSEYWR